MTTGVSSKLSEGASLDGCAGSNVAPQIKLAQLALKSTRMTCRSASAVHSQHGTYSTHGASFEMQRPGVPLEQPLIAPGDLHRC